jgi:hypothetical protein
VVAVLTVAREADLALEVSVIGPVIRALASDDWGNVSQRRGGRAGSSAGFRLMDGEAEDLGPDAGGATGPGKVLEGDGVCCLCL